MENKILRALNFDVTFPTAFRFLERFAIKINIDSKIFVFARYLLELALTDCALLKYLPSVLAASAIYLSIKFQKPCIQ